MVRLLNIVLFFFSFACCYLVAHNLRNGDREELGGGLKGAKKDSLGGIEFQDPNLKNGEQPAIEGVHYDRILIVTLERAFSNVNVTPDGGISSFAIREFVRPDYDKIRQFSDAWNDLGMAAGIEFFKNSEIRDSGENIEIRIHKSSGVLNPQVSRAIDKFLGSCEDIFGEQSSEFLALHFSALKSEIFRVIRDGAIISAGKNSEGELVLFGEKCGDWEIEYPEGTRFPSNPVSRGIIAALDER